MSEQQTDLLKKILAELQHFNKFNDMNPVNFPHSDALGWEVESVSPNSVIASKSTLPFIASTSYHGHVYFATMAFSSASMGFIFEVENRRGKIFKSEYTVQDLINAGLTSRSETFYVSKTGTGLHVITLNPAFPGVPFQKLYVKLKNDDSAAGTVYSAVCIMVRHFT